MAALFLRNGFHISARTRCVAVRPRAPRARAPVPPARRSARDQHVMKAEKGHALHARHTSVIWPRRLRRRAVLRHRRDEARARACASPEFQEVRACKCAADGTWDAQFCHMSVFDVSKAEECSPMCAWKRDSNSSLNLGVQFWERHGNNDSAARGAVMSAAGKVRVAHRKKNREKHKSVLLPYRVQRLGKKLKNANTLRPPFSEEQRIEHSYVRTFCDFKFSTLFLPRLYLQAPVVRASFDHWYAFLVLMIKQRLMYSTVQCSTVQYSA
eukprot:IDg7920t1